MKVDARNIIIGCAILIIVALWAWNVKLQKTNKYYQAEYQNEKKNYSKIIEDNKKEIEALRQKLIESERKNIEIQDKFDKEISDLMRGIRL